MIAPLTALSLTLVLAVVQIVAAALSKRRQEPRLWAMGPRDEGQPTYTGVAARLIRAQNNLFETLPVFIGAVLTAHAMGRDGPLAAWGATLYFGGRLIFAPVYAAGGGLIRTLLWIVAMIGLCLVLAACLLPV